MPNNDNYEYMRFLDLTGVQQIWDTAKQTFVQTVNGQGIDANGNVNVSGGITTDEGNFVKSEYNKTLNLFDIGARNHSVSAQGVLQTDTIWSVSKLISVLPNTQYTISGNTSQNWHFFYYDASKNFLSYLSTQTKETATITTPNNCYYMYAQCGATFSNVMLNLGSTSLTYQAYNGEVVHQKEIGVFLLWENATPNSSFTAQTISLLDALESGDLLAIEWKQSNESPQHYITYLRYIEANANKDSAFMNTDAKYGTTMYSISRLISFSNSTRIYFNHAFSNTSQTDEACIPYRIYRLNRII